ncbi:glycosyltransferase family 4 protein [Bacteroidota bacterium]|nr:glycosyltransferase family 4 protein [Bacteroidota bacterium]
MKIALLTNGLSPFIVGGMQKHSASIAVELVQAGHNVDLFHFIHRGQDLLNLKEFNNYYFNSDHGFNNVFCCFFPVSLKFPGHYIWNSIRYSKWIYKEICSQKEDYDFIYSKGFTAWQFLAKRKKNNFKTKVGVNFHGYEMFQFAPNFKFKIQQIFLRFFVKRIIHKTDFVFSYGGKITEIILSLGIDKTKILESPSAISIDWIKNNNIISLNTNLKFLFVGRYERRKGIQEINKAIFLLSKELNNCEFHFVGSIPENRKIHSDKLKIIYHGLIIDDIKKKKLYDKCDVLLCPSYSEGMPNVVLEAMARGLIIIATDVGAMNTLVSKDNGILIKVCKSSLIKDAIEKINLTEKKIILKMKYNSVKKIKKNFSWPYVLNSLIFKIKKII